MEFYNTQHIPVLAGEILRELDPRSGGFFVDGTLGGGGHTELLARAVGKEGTVLAMDRDIGAINSSEKRLRNLFEVEGIPWNIRFAHANYSSFAEALEMLEIRAVDGFLLDLGLSSDQLADRDRGFSFDSEGPLDLRFDTSEGVPAYVLLQHWSEERIANTVYEYGEEKFSRRIAREIVKRRNENRPVRFANELAELVRRCVPPQRKTVRTGDRRPVRIDSATRTFQALRIAVNDELGALESFLKKAGTYLKPGGRIAILSFHSLEDRIVKTAFRENSELEVLTGKPIIATEEEISSNPRSRSAKLRVARRVITD